MVYLVAARGRIQVNGTPANPRDGGGGRDVREWHLPQQEEFGVTLGDVA